MHKLEPLPYAYNALEPHIDEETMKLHHDKHHQTYVDKLNAALEKHKDLQGKRVDELLSDLSKVPDDVRNAVRNHGGGHFNHAIFWHLMKKDVKMPADLAKAIDQDFGSFESFKKMFTDAALNRFGSGWAWLVVYNSKLYVTSTANQDTPLSEGKKPILGIDVWEHAYYKKFGPKRADYIEAFFQVINWEYVKKLHDEALKGKSFSV